MARSEILSADAGSSQSQTQSQGATAKQKKKPIEAGGKEFTDVGILRAAARELKLVAAVPLPSKVTCIAVLDEYQKLKEAEDALDSVFADEDIPPVDDSDEDETTGDADSMADDASDGVGAIQERVKKPAHPSQITKHRTTATCD